MDSKTFREDMSSAYSRIGNGRLKMNEDIKQTGYGNKVVVNPETIVSDPEQLGVHPLVELYNKAAAEQAEKVTRQEEQALGLGGVHEEVEYPDMWYPPLESNSIVDKHKRYELQESKRAPKVQVDQKIVLLSWIIAVGVAFVSSALVSYNGITAVASFVGLSGTWMSGLFFFFIELMYLVFLVAYLVLASRVDDDGKSEKTGGAMLGMVAFGGIAVLANGFHTLDYWKWDVTNPQVWAGVVLSIAAPIAIISASKLASRVVFAKAISL